MKYPEYVNKYLEEMKSKNRIKKIQYYLYFFFIALIVLFFFAFGLYLQNYEHSIDEKKRIADSIINAKPLMIPVSTAKFLRATKSGKDIFYWYNYSIGLALTDTNKINYTDIDSVQCYFDDPSFIVILKNGEIIDYRLKSSNNPLDSFKISYEGIGTLRNVPIFIYRKKINRPFLDFKVDVINFEMAKNTLFLGH